MKSRTSFFNRAVFRKNLTRFAPAWGLYTICLLLGMLMMADSGTNYWFLSDMAACIQFMVVVNLCYAPLVALLLFGDLYNSRMCNALHAMPLRREGWFLTNVASGITFSLMPTIIMTIPSLLLSIGSDIAGGWQIPLYWLLGTNLSYLFFFGVAVLCAFLVGNRFAMVVLYGILNAAPMLVYVLVDTLYTPLLYGLQTVQTPFMWLTPVGVLLETEFLTCQRYNVNTPLYYAEFTVGEWWYLWLCAGIGILLMLLALQLYRKRKLECAGDFMAVKALEPVFLVIFTLAAGVVLYYVNQIFLGTETVMSIFFLALGILVGFFAGRMLLMRTVRVFQLRAFGGCAVMIAAIGLSMGITALDPLGIESWMPEKDQVESITVNLGHYAYIPTTRSEWGGDSFVVEDEADIAQILRVHELALAEQVGSGGIISTDSVIEEISYNHRFAYTLTYQLADGSTVSRYYRGYTASETGDILRGYLSSMECILGLEESELGDYLENIDSIYIDNIDVTEMLSDEQMMGLLEAIAADCAAGNTIQRSSFHEGRCDGFYCDINIGEKGKLRDATETDVYPEQATVVAEGNYKEWVVTYRYLTVYACCENIVQWVKDNDLEQYLYANQEMYYN